MNYYALSNISHDGKVYRRGDSISPTEAQAEELLEAGVISSEKPETTVAAPTVPPATEVAPKVGGESNKSGEPSLDGQDDQSTRKEAEDVTPLTAEDMERMTRPDLEELARSIGVDAKAAIEAPNKGALAELVIAKRDKAPEPETPATDASANL